MKLFDTPTSYFGMDSDLFKRLSESYGSTDMDETENVNLVKKDKKYPERILNVVKCYNNEKFILRPRTVSDAVVMEDKSTLTEYIKRLEERIRILETHNGLTHF